MNGVSRFHFPVLVVAPLISNEHPNPENLFTPTLGLHEAFVWKRGYATFVP